MKNKFVKLMVASLVFAVSGAVALPAHAEKEKKTEGAAAATAEKKEQTTVTGTAKAVPGKKDPTKKHLELTAADGSNYLLMGRVVAGEAVAQFDGKKVKVTGTVREREGKKTMYVGEIAAAE